MMSGLDFLTRFWDIGRISIRLLLKREVTPEVRLRLFFEQAGGAFVKLGQILSLRHDLIPPRYANELLNLLSRIRVSPYSAMRQVFIDEIGQPPEAVFQKFESKPIASASISQVYRARLSDGTPVVVKIQRPAIRQVFETDFLLARVLGRLLSFFRLFNTFQIQDVVKEFIAWSRRELDFREELTNSQILARHSESHPRTIIPRAYAEWSTERVLVSEDMAEVFSVETVLKELEKNPKYRDELLTNHSIHTEELAYYFVFDIMRQYFIDGFFHADPHPANLFFASNNRLGYFDFGIIGQVGKTRLDLLRIIYGIARRDLAFSSKHFLHFAKTAMADEVDLFKLKEPDTYKRYAKVVDKLEEIMLDNLQLDLEGILTPWYEEKTLPNYQHLTSSLVFSKILLKTRDYQIYLPREVVIFFRTLVIADMVAVKLAPGFDIIRALNSFFASYPLGVAEELIMAQTQEVKLEEATDSTAHFSFEQLLEVKDAEKEQLGVAKERLINIISAYAEDYEEIRQLLKA
jgi:predicted unusual protein kinase regulating ubiquinone biosynthesis (AarF/ABC1/UbiB family)